MQRPLAWPAVWPWLRAGDVVLVMQQKEHPEFKRVNIDLIMEKKINLTAALCGCTFTVKHLDGRVLKISTPPGAPWTAWAPGTPTCANNTYYDCCWSKPLNIINIMVCMVYPYVNARYCLQL